MKEWNDLKVGDTIWVFDINHRVYEKPLEGRLWASGGPIYRSHFVEHKIEGETSRSWIARYGTKYSKKERPHGVFITLEEVEDNCWLNGHRHKVASLVGNCQDAAIIRAIAELVGYKGEVADVVK